MTSRPMLIPSAEHPITVEATPGRVTVTVGDRVIADSTRALSLAEASYPVVQYVPLDDVDATVLRDSDTTTYCPYKGEASYFTVALDGQEYTDLIWCYRTPYPAVSEIAGHAAFYTDRAQVTVAPDG